MCFNALLAADSGGLNFKLPPSTLSVWHTYVSFYLSYLSGAAVCNASSSSTTSVEIRNFLSISAIIATGL